MRVPSTKIGDIFEVKIDDEHVKYMQYVVSDLTQLNSDVVRIFKPVYRIDEKPDIELIVKGEVENFVHCATKLGIKMGYWSKIGNSSFLGDYSKVTFRCSLDYGKSPLTEVSHSWWVWKINEDQVHVTAIEDEFKNSFIGTVFSPDSTLEIVKCGYFPFYYPRFG